MIVRAKLCCCVKEVQYDCETTYMNCAPCWSPGWKVHHDFSCSRCCHFCLSNSRCSVSHVSWKPERSVNRLQIYKFRISAITFKRFRFRLNRHAFSSLFRLFFSFELHLTEMSSNMINVLKGVRNLTSTVKRAGKYLHFFWDSNIPEKKKNLKRNWIGKNNIHL